MINIGTLLNGSRIACGEDFPNKKQVLEKLSFLLSDGEELLDSHDVFAALVARERLGSTDMGHGVAIPHIRFDAITSPRLAFISLPNAIEFNPVDKSQVDLIFALMVPEEATETHLQLLSQLAKVLHNGQCRRALRSAKDSADIIDIIGQFNDPND